MKTPERHYEIVKRKVGDLDIDPNVQRVLAKGRVATMAAHFDPEALGVLTTSYRPSGIIHVVDGQHRYRAAELAQYTGSFDTKEWHGLTVPEEAAMFRMLNTAQKPSAIDRFLMACVEQDADALRLSRFLTDHGWAVGAYSATAKITAIGSLERVYERSPEAAAAVLAVVTKAWGHQPAAVHGPLLEGLGRMLIKYQDHNVDLNDLAARLAGYPGGPSSLVGHARGQKLTHTGNLNTAVSRIITSIYNERRRSTKLPDWV